MSLGGGLQHTLPWPLSVSPHTCRPESDKWEPWPTPGLPGCLAVRTATGRALCDGEPERRGHHGEVRAADDGVPRPEAPGKRYCCPPPRQLFLTEMTATSFVSSVSHRLVTPTNSSAVWLSSIVTTIPPCFFFLYATHFAWWCERRKSLRVVSPFESARIEGIVSHPNANGKGLPPRPWPQHSGVLLRRLRAHPHPAVHARPAPTQLQADGRPPVPRVLRRWSGTGGGWHRRERTCLQCNPTHFFGLVGFLNLFILGYLLTNPAALQKNHHFVPHLKPPFSGFLPQKKLVSGYPLKKPFQKMQKKNFLSVFQCTVWRFLGPH